MDISVIIPAYNEEKVIKKAIFKVLNYLKRRKFNYELIVVNDWSKDKTYYIANEFAKKNKQVRVITPKVHLGKGNAVRTGMLAAKYNLALFTDADQSTPIEELDKFLKYSKDYDVVIASRAVKGANVKKHQPFYREFAGKVFNKIVRLLTVRGIVDTQCGFKLFKNPKQIFRRQRIMGWAFDVEVLFIAKRLGKRIAEVPVMWINNPETHVQGIKSMIDMFFEVLKVRINDLKGYYR